MVDDSVVVRRLVTNTLAEDPEIDVVGTAANGQVALAKIPKLNPDIVVLDLEMPEMDGLETLRNIRNLAKKPIVIMFSGRTEKGAVATLEALSLGASDYVTKPAKSGGIDTAIKHVREQLIPKIHLFGGGRIPASPRSAATPAPARPRRKTTAQPIDLLAIGVSTGGPNALAEVLPRLPADFPVPTVIVQHMPPLFTKSLAERLSRKCHLHVCEASAGDMLRVGHVYIAPGDYHMVTCRSGAGYTVATNQNPPENSCRPAVDVLFRSVAKVFGGNVLVVILTGMGQDGLEGCRDIHEKGGQIIVQDERSSVVWGMAGAVAGAGIADKILPLSQIGSEIVRRVSTQRKLATV